MTAYFRVLGPVDVVLDGQVVSLGAAKSRVLLAALLLRSNQYVSTAQVMAALWGDRLPTTARATLHTYVMRLRKNLQQYLAGDRCPLRTEPGGYFFEASTLTLDVIAFDHELTCARHATRVGDLVKELDHLDRALAIWRGPAISNVDSDLLHRDEIPRLTEQRLKAIERRTDIQMAMGRAGDLIPELRSYTAEYPRRERFWSQLIEALCRTGRPAEALSAYQTVKEHLAEELGVDPGPELRGLQLRILHGGVETDLPEVPTTSPAIRMSVPTTSLPRWEAPPACQLPIDVRDFVGRRDLAAGIVEELLPRQGRAAPAIVAISGAPGVGKSALAVHAAWHVREHYPHGQWFISLRNGAGVPRDREDVLAELLQAAGVPQEKLPVGEGARVGALRAALTGRRVLLVLDDMGSIDQVTQLLPGAAGCAVLLTSRCCTIGFAALHGGRAVQLEELSPDESMWLLGRLIGAARPQAEPEAAQRLVKLCGGLPHALRIAAGHLDQAPQRSLHDYLGLLAERGPLDWLSSGLHPAWSLKDSFQSAFQSLSAVERKSFLSLGREFSSLVPDEAAKFLDLSPNAASRLLDRLASVHLIRYRHGRYELPELQRGFARSGPHGGVPGEELE